MNNTPNNENTLDEQSLIELVDNYSAKLTSYVYRRTRNLEVARDIVQESFLRLTKAKDKPSKKHVVPWLYFVCRNLSIDYLRKQSKWICDGTEILEHYCSGNEPDPARTTIQSETIEILKECIQQLPERHREIVELKFEGGLSYREIAKVTQLSESNVGFILHQSVARVRYEMVKLV